MSQSVLQNRNRIQWITRQYHSLRGLGLIPVGICLLIEAAARAGWLPWYESWQPLPYIIMWALMGAAWWRIDSYYTTTFGQVQHPPKDPGQSIFLGGGFFWLFVASVPLNISYPGLPVSHGL